MHDDELDVTPGLVRRLLRAQFPQWADRPLLLVGAGTDNVMMRLGDDLVVRLPRRAARVGTIELEQRWLPVLAPHLPLPVPEPIGLGRPDPGYPVPWSVQRWLAGDHAFTDLRTCAVQLASFLAALQRVDPAGAPTGYRGGPAAGWDGLVQDALRDLDVPGGAELWAKCLRQPAYEGPPVWTHGDLLPANLLASDGRLAAVLDFGCAGVGDPACDLMPAWTLFDGPSRAVFRAALGAGDAAWERGRAWAFAFGIAAWHYYPVTNPPFAALGRHTVNQTLTNGTTST